VNLKCLVLCPVLRMTCPHHHLSVFSFRLLGASGCGKTTLLRCILSSLDPDYGDITLLGSEPGITQSHVPGRDVGYMPQVSYCAGLDHDTNSGVYHRT